MTQKISLQFPKRFLWGASTAAHQVEGHQSNQWTVWELEHAKALAAQAEYQYGDLESWSRIRTQAMHPENYVSGKAANHYELYEQDFDLLKKLGLNSFRFSIEWSRIEPKEGVWNSEALHHYKEYIAALKSRNIEPVMTLFHFTLPVWFTDKGGFEKRANVKYFVRYVEKVMADLKGVKYIITINEPEVYATESYLHGHWPPSIQSKRSWWRVMRNLAYAHKKSAKLIHSLGRRYHVSIAKNSNYFYPGDDAWLTRLSASVMQYVQDDYFLKKVHKHCDFLGVNYYFSNRVYGYRIHNPNEATNDLGWDMQPENIEYVLERLYKKYKLPIIVTENGLADATDEERKWWLTKTMIGLSNALKEGVDVRGYLHWSLLDNFEWAQGKWPRFGLVEINYATQERTIRSSALWWARVIKQIKKDAK